MPQPSNKLNDIRLVAGQTKSIVVQVKTKEGRPAQLSGANMYMSVRKTAGSPILIAKTLGNGISVTNQATGEAVVLLDTSDTMALSAGAYRYDVWVEFPGDPPSRHPVVKYAEIHVEDSVTEFAQ